MSETPTDAPVGAVSAAGLGDLSERLARLEERLMSAIWLARVVFAVTGAVAVLVAPEVFEAFKSVKKSEAELVHIRTDISALRKIQEEGLAHANGEIDALREDHQKLREQLVKKGIIEPKNGG